MNTAPNPTRSAGSISQREGESEGRAILRPTVNSARTLRRVLQEQAPNLALMDLAAELGDQCTKVVGGDLTRPEALLLTQGVALDVLFHDLTRLAYDYLAEHGDAAERLFRSAFRAQGQRLCAVPASGRSGRQSSSSLRVGRTRGIS
jgi:hypothetical protein